MVYIGEDHCLKYADPDVKELTITVLQRENTREKAEKGKTVEL